MQLTPDHDALPRERFQKADGTYATAEALAQDHARLRKRLWPKLKRLAATLPFAEDILGAYYCAFDAATPRHVQAALLGAVAYFILPFDFIPDLLPVLGFTDDAAILAAAIRTVAAYMTPAHRETARAALEQMKREGTNPLP